MLQFLILVVVLGVLYLAYGYLKEYLIVRRIRASEQTQDPHKHPLSSIIGLARYKDIERSIKNKTSLDSAVRDHEAIGNTHSSYIFGRPIIDTREPENIKAVLATQFEQFSLGKSRYDGFHALFGDGIFTHLYGGGELGAPWRHSRVVLRPQFTRQQVQDLGVVEQFVQNMITRIPPNETCDLQDLFFKFTMDTATDFLFGESVNSLSPDCPPSELKFYKQFTRGTEICLLRVGLGDLYFLQGDRKEFAQICKEVHAYIDKFTQKALQLRASGKPTSASTGGKYVFLEEIAQNIDDPVRLRSELLNILLAGRDTTAGLLSICFHQLARHKDIFAELRREIMDNIGNRLPTYEDIKSLTYLRYVLNETLRLYPVVPLNFRDAVVTTTLPRGGGPDGKSKMVVKKGTSVFYSTWSLHRSEFYGPDAKEFNPRRWETLRPGWNYLPFNGGPRICLGQQYALTEASYVVIRLLQTFEDIENRDPVLPFIEGLTVTLCSGRGTQVAMKPAQSA